ncbi:sensor domain-containing diguanylate cyclase [Pararhodospirillum oryzae]|uniref:sensor domain-containing diguanylate cyclase n=1 Tax=Pararhodospirillum oryzae TaxID=478448 RepID=UPI001478129B|nr:sensor domain-containing diguanylate cyclase [Pararhodospirillum oryzae]
MFPSWQCVRQRVAALWESLRVRAPSAVPDTPFRKLVEGASQGVLVAQGVEVRPLYANRAMATLLRLAHPAELTSRASLLTFLMAPEAEEVREVCSSLLNGRLERARRHLEVVRPDQSTVWLDMTVTVCQWDGQDALAFSFRDITEFVERERDLEFSRGSLESQAAEMIALAEATHLEHARAEAAREDAERQRRFLQTLVATIPSPLYYKDRDGRILGCNAAFARLYGRSDESEVVGLTVHDLAVPDYAKRTDVLDAALFDRGGAERYDRTFPGPDGTARTLIFNKAVFTDANGVPAGVVGVITDISEQKRLENELRRLATTDSLTGALNRRAFLDEAHRLIGHAQRYHEPLSVILSDIDHFKRINDTHGHAVGDLALRLFVVTLRNRLRESDVLGRIGGEEFAIVLPHAALPEAMKVAEDLRMALANQDIETPHGPLVFTASLGVAELGTHGTIIDAVMQAADAALYTAKALGRNRVVAASESRPASTG